MNQWENDPVLRRYSDGPQSSAPAETLKSTRNFLKKVISSQDPGILRTAICTKRGALIGFSMIAFIDKSNRSCKLGITIGEQAEWGKGYAREALRGMIRQCFFKLKMNRIGAEIYSFNERSIRLFKSLGFRREGVLRQAILADGVFYDEHLYGLLRKEWLKLAGGGGRGR